MGQPPPTGSSVAPASQAAVSLVEKPIEDAGKHHTSITTTFMLACLYAGITVASTTHKMLLLGASLPLPILNVPIPLVGFYLVAPLVVFSLHAHLLLQNHVLGRRLRDPRTEALGDDKDFFLFPALPVLRHALKSEEVWVSRFVREGLFAIHVVLPLSVLCLTQYKFLPYHDPWVTFWHQFLITADLAALWYFLGWLPSRSSTRRWWSINWRWGAVLATGLVVLYSFVLAIVPGTWIEVWTGKHWLADWLPRNLKLPRETLIVDWPEPELLAAAETTGEDRDEAFFRHAVGADLAGRDLRGANFEWAKLFKANLQGADLTGADMEGANLRGAVLTPMGVSSSILNQERGGLKSREIWEECRKARFRPTRLDGAKLKKARFKDAKLIMASLSRADLKGAYLAGVELTCADLTWALLQNSNLRGGELSYASIEGADLTGAQAFGATFDHAFLSATSLDRIEANAASFASAHLEGAQLTQAKLQGAEFNGADLFGSDFRLASLQGAKALSLAAIDLRGAHLGGVDGTVVLGLTDLRFVELDSEPEWPKMSEGVMSQEERISKWVEEMRKWVSKNLPESSDQEIGIVQHRIEDAERRRGAPPGARLGTLLIDSMAVSRNLGALHLDADQNVAVDSRHFAGATWNEAVFHRELAARLLREACTSQALAVTATLRAAGEHGPRDREFDLELARQLLVKLRDPECRLLRQVSVSQRFGHLKRQIEWRLRRQGRAEEELHQ